MAFCNLSTSSVISFHLIIISFSLHFLSISIVIFIAIPFEYMFHTNILFYHNIFVNIFTLTGNNLGATGNNLK